MPQSDVSDLITNPHGETIAMSPAYVQQAETEITLDALVYYVLTTSLVMPLWYRVVKYMALGLGFFGSMWMYIMPSWLSGQGDETQAWLQVIGNTLAAGLVVFNIGTDYFRSIEASQDYKRFLKSLGIAVEEYDPTCLSQLKRVFNVLRQNELDVLILAALTAMPLLAAALSYRDYTGESDALEDLKAVVTFLVYTLIHTLPIRLILNVPKLRFLLVELPAKLFGLPVDIYRLKAWSNKQWTQKGFDLQTKADREKIRRLLSGSFKELSLQLEERLKRKSGVVWEVRWKEDDPQDERSNPHVATQEILEVWIKKIRATEKAKSADTKHWMDKGLGILSGLTGGTLVGASISGFLAVNYNLFKHMLLGSMMGAILLVAAPAIVTEVLTIYFGMLAFMGVYEYSKAWLTGHPKIPTAFKLSPIFSTLFLSTTWFLSVFSYGTAQQLVRDNIDESFGWWRSLFLFTSQWGLIVYGCINMAQLTKRVTYGVKQLFADSQTREFLEKEVQIGRVHGIVSKLKPEYIESLVTQLSDDTKGYLFSAEEQTEINKSLKHGDNYQQSIRGRMHAIFFKLKACCPGGEPPSPGMQKPLLDEMSARGQQRSSPTSSV